MPFRSKTPRTTVRALGNEPGGALVEEGAGQARDPRARCVAFAATAESPVTVWEPLAGALGEHIVNALAEGAEIGRTLLDLRRQLLVRDNNMLGFVYRLQALSETTATLQARPAETIEIDLRDREPSRLEDSAS